MARTIKLTVEGDTGKLRHQMLLAHLAVLQRQRKKQVERLMDAAHKVDVLHTQIDEVMNELADSATRMRDR